MSRKEWISFCAPSRLLSSVEHSALDVERISFALAKYQGRLWMPAPRLRGGRLCAVHDRKNPQQPHSRESENPVPGKRIGNLL
jgi:hypothetical protein